MKVLVLGIDGMIGHKIAQSIQNNYELFGTSKKDIKNQDIGLNQGKIVKHDFLKNNLESLLKKVSPSVIINCVGITPRRGINESIKNSKLLNSKLSINFFRNSLVKASVSSFQVEYWNLSSFC